MQQEKDPNIKVRFWPRRHPILSALLMLWLTFYLYDKMRYWLGLSDEAKLEQGICLELGRPLTDDEKIRAALGLGLTVPKVPVRRGDEYIYFPHVPYESVDEILEKFPNCCKVVPSTAFQDKKDWGWGNVAVAVKYFIRYREDGQIHTLPVQDQLGGPVIIHLDNCGRSF